MWGSPSRPWFRLVSYLFLAHLSCKALLILLGGLWFPLFIVVVKLTREAFSNFIRNGWMHAKSFSCALLFVAPWTIAWPVPLYTGCFFFLTGKNTGMFCHFLLQEISPPRDRTCISCISCIGTFFFFFYHHATWEYKLLLLLVSH